MTRARAISTILWAYSSKQGGAFLRHYASLGWKKRLPRMKKKVIRQEEEEEV